MTVEHGAHSASVRDGVYLAVALDRFGAYGSPLPRKWELYVVVDGYLEMFSCHAEPWQCALIERLVQPKKEVNP